eukprot:CAMPEP_0204540948 /NCGR_PEP_ID=MMETSP0661-20131031/17869_1 /ASSEMBLY_ACC=CAM_ASM_000606 /TAXON_ID=109239 /ORGANISM="Alexandrium margalefi, Strain AMGDE01CS-322" /LENGTH=189 /DNA_ID=CAMNT_0051547617 /DNA_START=337 /DNA_END=902 /DNA_ORIENTATION=-
MLPRHGARAPHRGNDFLVVIRRCAACAVPVGKHQDLAEGMNCPQARVERRVVVIGEVHHAQGDHALGELAEDVGAGVVPDELAAVEARVDEGVGIVPHERGVRAVGGQACGLRRHVLGGLQEQLRDAHVICLRVVRPTFVRLELVPEPGEDGAPQVVDGVAVDVLPEILRQLSQEVVPAVATEAAAPHR